MVRQPTWDEHEAAILLEGLLAMEAGQATREETVRRVSRTLRQMAVAKGVQVDERYRNINGISLQLGNMEDLLRGDERKIHCSRIFRESVSLYREDRSAFDKLLREAKTMAGVPISVKGDFLQYLSSQVKPGRLPALTACYDEIEDFCRGRKILKDPLFETTDIKVVQSVRDTIEGNRLFKVQHRKQHKDYVEACQHYFNYIKHGLFLRCSVPEEGQTLGTAVLVPEQEAAPAEDTVTAMISEEKQTSAEDTVAATIQEEKPELAEEPTQADPAPQVPKESARVARKSGLPASGEIPVEWVFYNFSNYEAFTDTEPAYCAVGGQIVEGNSWTEVLVRVTERELRWRNPAIADLYTHSLLGHQRGKPYFMKEKKEGLTCIRLSNGYWINVNYAVSALVTMIGEFCLHCGYRKAQIIIYGAAKEASRTVAAPAGITAKPKEAIAADAFSGDGSVSKKATVVEIQDNWIRFDFSNFDDFAGTVPAYCAVGGQVVEGNSWNRILGAITDLEIQKGNTALSDLYDCSLLDRSRNTPYLMKEKKVGQNCILLSNGYWINVNYNTHSIMRMIGAFCQHCGYSKDQVELYGVVRGTSRSHVPTVRPSAPPAQSPVLYSTQTDAAVTADASGGDASVSKKPAAVKIQDDWIRYDFSNFFNFIGTVPAYCAVDGQVLKGKSWDRILGAITNLEIQKGNTALSDLYECSLLDRSSNTPYLMKEEKAGKNCIQLSNGYWINVNYNIHSIMRIIGAFCLHCGYSKEQVELYGMEKRGRGNAGSRPSVSRMTSRSGGQEIFLNKAEEYLQSVGLSGASVGQIAKTLQPGVSVSALTKALGDSPRVICFHGGRYVHADCLVDLDEAEETMRGILRGHFAQFEGYSNDQLLFSAASAELSMFLNDNDCDNKEDVYAIARHFFEKGTADGERYTFRSPHIFQEPPDYPTTLRGLMIHLARCGDGILRANDAKTFLEKTMLTYGGLNQLLKIDSQATFLLYDEGTYLLSDMLGIDKAWCLRLGERLDDLFRTEDVAYAVLRDISTEWLDTLPTLPQNLQWNRLLLQEVLRNYPDVGFRPIRADLHQTFDTLAAAIVPTESPLQTFPDVVWLYMEEHATLPVRMTGEELRRTLQGAGMLAVGEMISSLPKALHDYRFAWDGENKTVYILSG